MINEKELVEQIKNHDNNYWVLNNPVISDIEYDKLKQQLMTINPNHELLFNHISTGQYKHPELILSLKKIYNKSDIISYLSKIVRNKDELLYVAPKYDGITGVLYNQKILTTGGDNIIGENISDKLPNINFITTKKEIPKIFKGELIFKNSYFNDIIYPRFLRKDKQNYKTPRTAVAGILNTKGTLDSDIKIDFVDYLFNFYSVKFKELIEYIDYLDNIYTDIDYNLDGIVIKILDESYAKTLGKTANYYKSAIAYKFSQEQKWSNIIDIEWTVGMNNVITPTAILNPIVINNVTITKVTLHNAGYILDNSIKINSKLLIERTGDATPTIISIDNTDSTDEITINDCPCCYSELIYDPPHLKCTNSNCIGMLTKKIMVGLKRLNINGFGETVTFKILNTYSKIKNISDIFKLSQDEFSTISLGYLYKELKNSKSKIIYDYELLSCLCIDGFGKELCKQLCKNIKITELFNDTYDLSHLPNFGYERTNKFMEHLNHHSDIINELFLLFTNIKYSIDEKDSLIQSVYFSGEFPQKKTYYYEFANKLGYKPVDTFSKSCLLLVIPTSDFISNKVEKAIKWDIEIKTLDEFLTMK